MFVSTEVLIYFVILAVNFTQILLQTFLVDTVILEFLTLAQSMLASLALKH
jgi:hypothetical protein